MRVAVIGAGGVGGLLGGVLARAGIEVGFLARGQSLQALAERGLNVDSPLGQFSIHPVVASADPGALGSADVVLVAVKAWQVSEIAPSLRPLLKQSTTVIPVQNGVEASDELQAALPPQSVVGGICHVIAWVDKPGHIVHKGIPPQLTLGELDGSVTPRLEKIAEAFRRAGISMTLSPNIRGDLWEKLLFVEPLGSIGAVTRVPVDVFRSVPESRAMLLEAMREVERVSAALAIRLRPDALERSIVRIDGLPTGSTASMHRDIVEGRPSELEQQTGAVVRLGRQANAAAPVHEWLRAALLPQELQARNAERSLTPGHDRGSSFGPSPST
jgi:2-dehydropantoate 2-reductase